METTNIPEDLNLAIAVNSIDIVNDILADERLEINGTDARGHSPLIVACAYGRKEIVQVLLDHKADIMHMNVNTKLTALHVSASNGFHDICELLLERGALASLRDHNGSTPLEYADISPQPQVGNEVSVERLEAADARLVQMRQGVIYVLSGS